MASKDKIMTGSTSGVTFLLQLTAKDSDAGTQYY